MSFLRALALATTLTSFSSVAVSAAQIATDAVARQLIDQAEERLRSGDREGSLLLLSRAMQELDAIPDSSKNPEQSSAMVRALYRRAAISIDEGDRETGTRDIQRLLGIAPNTRVDSSLVTREFAELFTSVRARVVTELEIVVEPADAEVRIDERLLDSVDRVAVLKSGGHVVVVTRAGHGSERRELDLPAGRMRLEIRLNPLAGDRHADGEDELVSPKRWVVRHLHNSLSDCDGRLYIEADRIGFSSVNEKQHSFEVLLTTVQEIAGNRTFQGGMKYGGTFHIKLGDGANFNFVSTAFPADQLVSLLQAAIAQHKGTNRNQRR
jgi:hypothetical protein